MVCDVASITVIHLLPHSGRWQQLQQQQQVAIRSVALFVSINGHGAIDESPGAMGILAHRTECGSYLAFDDRVMGLDSVEAAAGESNYEATLQSQHFHESSRPDRVIYGGDREASLIGSPKSRIAIAADCE